MVKPTKTGFDGWRLLAGVLGAILLWVVYDSYEADASGWKLAWAILLGGVIGGGLIWYALTERWIFDDEAQAKLADTPAKAEDPSLPSLPLQSLGLRGRVTHTIVGIGVVYWWLQVAGSLKGLIFSALDPFGLTVLGTAALSLWGGITGRNFWGPFMKYEPSPPDQP